ncbi:MAG: M14 family metallopeptidase, partial [Candidatus Aminicenantes bacterium]|nr:M14 family metallopeptidase [Candidatus Aminicenantes bacterium]
AGLTAAAVTSPKQQFGFDIGDDYCLVNYRQLAAYWQKLDAESDRLKVFDIGRTAEDRTMLLAVITSPRNHSRLARYKAISRRLGLAEGLTEAEARRLAAEGRSVVWIDGGLHATEILGSQQLIELVWQMTSRNDPETLRFLDDVILLACCPNPDGLDLVADWYLREKDPQKRSMAVLPRLYQKYIGHDNNRDFYMVTQPETEAVARVFYQEWFPQIVYNHHQSGPAGTVLFAPPFRNPFNYDFDPLVPVGIDLVASAMHNRFIAENKPGATMRSGARYSTWWSGGLRSTSYFHNMIGILTETIGNPTPLDIPFLPQKLLPSTDLPYPITPQKWHFRQSIDYLMTADRAVLDTASKYRQELLFRRYLMGRNSIMRGRRDFWTIQPRDVAAVQDLIDKDKTAAPAGRFRGYPLKYFEAFRDPAKRDPRGFIIPSDQPDFSTAVKFANTLIKNGVTVLRATRAFEVAGRNYPAGSLAVKCDQAFRPHILSQFEPQNHPHDFEYPGGPPLPPYDNAGWTLAFQM